MKRLLLLLACMALGAASAAAQDQGVSLGDAARAARARKTQPSPNARVFTNDNLPTNVTLSTSTGDFGGASAAASVEAAEQPASGGASTSASAAGGKSAAPKTEEEIQKAKEEEYKKKVADQKGAIALLERELDVLQRENRMRAATYYADVGNRMRDQKKYDDDDKKYQDQTTAKQAEVAAAKQKLEELRDEIRKAGLPSSIGE